MEKVIITQHALDRWRERAAAYADATDEDLRLAFRKASPVQENEPVPFLRKPGSRYFFHSSTGAYFFVTPYDKETLRVDTVIVPGDPVNYLTPKIKGGKPLPTVASIPVRKTGFVYVPEQREWPSFKNATEEYYWLSVETRKVNDEQAALYGPGTKNRRAKLAARLGELKARMALVKPLFVQARIAAEEMDLFQANGNFNYNVCFHYLLDRVAEMQLQLFEAYDRIAELRQETVSPKTGSSES